MNIIGFRHGKGEGGFVRPARPLQQLAHQLPALGAIGRDRQAASQFGDCALGKVEISERLDIALLDHPVDRPEPRRQSQPHEVDLAAFPVLEHG